jgi:hypothetical protein
MRWLTMLRTISAGRSPKHEGRDMSPVFAGPTGSEPYALERFVGMDRDVQNVDGVVEKND